MWLVWRSQIKTNLTWLSASSVRISEESREAKAVSAMIGSAAVGVSSAILTSARVLAVSVGTTLLIRTVEVNLAFRANSHYKYTAKKAVSKLFLSESVRSA